jgi:hypothetical protein
VLSFSIVKYLAALFVVATAACAPAASAPSTPTEADGVFQHLADARSKNGKALPGRFAPTARLLAETDRVSKGVSQPNEAIAVAAADDGCRFEREMAGWTTVVDDVDGVDFPPELTAADELAVSVTTTHAAGSPRLVVLVLVVGPHPPPAVSYSTLAANDVVAWRTSGGPPFNVFVRPSFVCP